MEKWEIWYFFQGYRGELTSIYRSRGMQGGGFPLAGQLIKPMGNAIWQRWAAYASNGHGANRDLMRLLKEQGTSYLENFQYSILEVITKNDNGSFIDAREKYWKTALRSREFGYDDN
jgi:hypothetical protein